MIFLDHPLSKEEIESLKRNYGDYLKLTIDLKNNWVVAGSELHADGEKELLEKGSQQEDIWGGGIDLEKKIMETTAVLNLRPRFGNDSMEILDPERRNLFIEITKRYFKNLWS